MQPAQTEYFHDLYVMWRASAKEVAVWGRFDTDPHLGDQTQLNSLEGWIGVFKPKSQNIKTWILLKLLNRF